MKHHSLKHYTDTHYDAIKNATTYEELMAIALDVLKGMPKPIAVVCGPISTGGLGNIAQNLRIFDEVIIKLADEGHNIFNQMPFEKPIQALREKYSTDIKEQNQIILDRFYLTIYNSGLITKMFFIHGWESSHGAKWERNIAQNRGIETIDLPKDFLEHSKE
ncbi:MAG: hypothetical protein ACP5NW_04685 [Candidatus Woesearchaeota archaeon]